MASYISSNTNLPYELQVWFKLMSLPFLTVSILKSNFSWCNIKRMDLKLSLRTRWLQIHAYQTWRKLNWLALLFLNFIWKHSWGRDEKNTNLTSLWNKKGIKLKWLYERVCPYHTIFENCNLSLMVGNIKKKGREMVMYHILN